MSKGADRVRQMLENVEHRDQGIRMRGPKALVERLHVYPRPPGSRRIHERSVGLDPLDVAELAQAIEEQAVPTAHIQNRSPRSPATQGAQRRDDDALARAPPP